MSPIPPASYKPDVKPVPQGAIPPIKKRGLRVDGLTEPEGKVLDLLVDAFNEFCKLERQHPNEGTDFTDGIHKCQSVLALRIVRREYPEGWPKK